MNRTRWLGFALVVIGAVLIAIGYREDPPRMLSVIAGVLFVLAGIIRFARAPRIPPAVPGGTDADDHSPDRRASSRKTRQ